VTPRMPPSPRPAHGLSQSTLTPPSLPQNVGEEASGHARQVADEAHKKYDELQVG